MLYSNFLNSISKRIKNIDKNLSIPYLGKDNKRSYSILLKAYKDMLFCANILRNYLSENKLEYNDENTDDKITNPFDIMIDRIDYDFYYVYKLYIPIILPKEKEQFNKQLWKSSFRKAAEDYIDKYNKKINLISNPIIIFENCFTSNKKNKGLKDADNYSITEVLNNLQCFFVQDDRNATIAIKNIYNAKQSGTTIIILPEENITDYLLNNF